MWSWWCTNTWGLVLLRMNVLRHGSGMLTRHARCLATAQDLQTSLDVYVARIEVGGSLVCIEGIGGLVVARFVLSMVSVVRCCLASTYQGAQVVPHFGNVRIQTDGFGVGVKSIAILIDLVVQDTDGTPEGGIATISIHGLLVGLEGFGILALGDVAPSQEVPTLGIVVVCTRQCPLERWRRCVGLT